MSVSNNKTPIGKALSKPVSRRHFFSISAVVGSLSVIGMTTTNKTATIAYADEAGNVHYNVVEINREEIPVLAVDVSKNSEPIPGMEVKVSSYDLEVYQDKEISETVVTDQAGTATINVKKLSEDSEELLDNYFAGLKIIAKKDGYQIYEENYNLAFSGGTYSNIQIATKPIQSGVPYVSCLTLAGSDVAWNWQQIVISTDNDYVYDMQITIRNFPQSAYNKVASLTLTSDRKEFAIENISDKCTQESPSVVKGTVDNDGIAKFNVKGNWFDDQDPKPHVGSKIIAYVNVEGYGRVIVVPKIKCTTGKFFAKASDGIDQTLRPGTTEGIMTTEKAEDPSNMKPITGKDGPVSLWSNEKSALNFSIPFIGMNYWSDGNGMWGITLNLLQKPFVKKRWIGKTGEPVPADEKKWKWFPDTGFKKWAEDIGKKWDDCKDAAPTNKEFKSTPWTSDFDFSLKVMGAVIFYETQDSNNNTSNDEEINSRTSKAKLSLQASFSVSYEGSMYYFIWFVPISISVDVTANLSFNPHLILNLIQDKTNKITSADYELPAASAALELQFLVAAGFTVGVGIKGVLGVFIRAYINLLITYTIYQSPKPSEFTISWEGGIQVYLELVIFTKTLEILPSERRMLYPREESLNSADDFVINNSTTSESDFKLITEEMLKGVLEKVATINENGWVKPSYYSSEHTNVVSKFNSKSLPKNFEFKEPYSKDGSWLYNPERGFRVEYDHVIAKDIFFSSHMTTFLYQGDLYILRISSVEIDVAGSDDFSVYSNGISNFIVANENAKVPKVKRDKDNNVLLDANQNVVYDIPSGMKKEDVAVFGDDCFEGIPGFSNASKQERVNAFFNMREAKGAQEKAFLNNKKLSNSTSVVRTRVTCSKYNMSTGQWDLPRVVDFPVPSTGNVIDERYNCFDSDMDVAVDSTQVRIVLTGTTRANMQTTEPKVEEVFQTQHVYSLTYNVITGEVKNVVVHAGNVHYSPKMPAFNWFSCYKHPSTANDFSDAGLYLYDQNYGYTMLNTGLEWGDPRIDDNFSSGVYENHIVGEKKSVNTYSVFSAWYSPATPEVPTETNYGGLAAFWTTYYHEDVTGHYEIKHHFNFLEPCVESITYLGQANISSTGNYDKCIRYLITRSPDADKQKRYDVLTFLFNSKTGEFNPTYQRAHDMFGSSRLTKVYPGQDANHLYASRIMDGPEANYPKTKLESTEQKEVYTTKGPFTPGVFSPEDPDESGSLYQLVEGRWSDAHQSFFHMFPIAQLDYEPDSIEYLSTDDYLKYFMVTNVTNYTEVKGNIHIVGVPYITAIQLDSFEAGNTNIQPGDDSYVDLSISNTGNVPISGFTTTIQVNDGSHDPFYIRNNAKLTDLSPYFILDDLPNYKAVLDPETGKPTIDPATNKVNLDLVENPLDSDGVLWPGITRIFRFNFTLPKYYEGEVVIKASVKDPIAHNDSLFSYELPSANSNREMLTCYDPREFVIKVDSEPIANLSEVEVSDVDYQIVDERGKVIDETHPKNLNTDDYDSPLDHSAATSATADTTPVNLGLGALAVGAAAAGVAAYEKRRAENENINDAN